MDNLLLRRRAIAPKLNVSSGQLPLTIKGRRMPLKELNRSGLCEQKPVNYLATVTQSGKCEQRNLSAEYTELEYIQSSGTQWIDTGITNEDCDSYGVKTKYSYTDGNSNSLCGNFVADSNAASFGQIYVDSEWRSAIWSGQGNMKSCEINGIDINTLYTDEFHIDCTTGSITRNFNGTELTETGLSFAARSNKTCLLFACNSSNGASQLGSEKIYYFQIFKDGALVLNLLPCKNSSNVVGMYDLISGTFFTNQGTGSFSAGPNATPTPERPMDIWCNNGALRFGKQLTLDPTRYYAYTNTNLQWSYAADSYSIVVPVMVGKKYKISIDASTTATILRYGFVDTVYESWKDGIVRPSVTTVETYDAVRTSPQETPSVVVTAAHPYLYIQMNAATFAQDIANGLVRVYEQSVYADGTAEVITDANGNTASAVNLFGVDNYADTQEVISGAVTRNVGIKVLDGTEEWLSTSIGNGIFRNIGGASGRLEDNNYAVICSHFRGVPASVSGTGLVNGDIRFGASTIAQAYDLYIKMDALATADELKAVLAAQYAAGTPVMIVYPLATATTESVAGQVLVKAPLTVTAEVSSPTITTTEAPVSIPDPVHPLPVWCNNGELRFGLLGKNLFDPTKVLFGYYIDRTTGDKRRDNSNFMSSDDGYIPCLPNTIYAFVGTNKTDGTYSKYNTIYFFDSAKNYLGGVTGAMRQPITGTTPSNCHYLQIRSNPLDTSSVSIQDAFSQFNWQLELGPTATTYEPYKGYGVYADGTPEVLTVSGNLWNESAVTWTAGSIGETTGQPASSQISHYSNAILVKPNTTYFFSIIDSSMDNQNYKRIHGYATEDLSSWVQQEALIYTSSSISSDTLVSCTFMTSATTNYIRLSVGNLDYDIMLCEGSQSVPAQTASVPMLLSVGNYKDTAEIISGLLTGKVGVKVLDGTENWDYASARFSLLISDKISNKVNVLCNYFTYSAATSVNMPDLSIISYESKSIGVRYDRFTSVAQFKQWLADQYAAGAPVIILFPLATPTTEQVQGQALYANNGTNTVESEANVSPVDAEIKYYK